MALRVALIAALLIAVNGLQVQRAGPEIAPTGAINPCAGIKAHCGELVCPGGSKKVTYAGHCCPYCVNPNIKLADLVTGATGEHGGKASTFCKDVWCFPTLCEKPETSPTTTNGQCCPACPAL
eukprot:gnl/MRDRNA2_/MRDRNA2_29384_c0_seq2.p2 gnl/MRDRNA2_/MRDRNA2_29384_c0~~gnl/MRDRNA2_/MRDRNA2_29384_c0_seq2.p2  ORF type:complete len:123 (-),score=20.52 gnl/MRDRNA2_/MRDRNA2_29384_c0_seq2:13-381(-)